MIYGPMEDYASSMGPCLLMLVNPSLRLDFHSAIKKLCAANLYQALKTMKSVMLQQCGAV